MKYCILYIKSLPTNFTSNIKRSFKGINQQLLFLLKIPCFSYDFRKIPRNSEAIPVKNIPGRKNVCSKSAIETAEQTEIARMNSKQGCHSGPMFGKLKKLKFLRI